MSSPDIYGFSWQSWQAGLSGQASFCSQTQRQWRKPGQQVIFGNFWWLWPIKVLINTVNEEKANNLSFLFPRCFVTKVAGKAWDTAPCFFSFVTEEKTISTILFSPIILINAVLWCFFLYFSETLNFRYLNHAKWSKINYPIFTLWK